VIGVMSVEVGESIYAIPVNTIREIVNLRTYPAQQVGGRPVLRIRDGLYPLMPCAAWFDDEPVSEPRFAVIVHADGAAAALGVDRVLGHQEIVIEPVGLPDEHVGPFLGAAIRGGGEVCLVIDVRQAIAIQGTSASAQAA
ncbi:MAG: chemotaxis protein CheW, partial [Planctomycetota bacterium]